MERRWERRGERKGRRKGGKGGTQGRKKGRSRVRKLESTKGWGRQIIRQTDRQINIDI